MQRQLAFEDEQRIEAQLRRIFELMKDGEPRTLAEIREALGLPPDAAVSARLRDFRKKKCGKHKVELFGRPLIGKGVFAYKLTVNPLHPFLPPASSSQR